MMRRCVRLEALSLAFAVCASAIASGPAAAADMPGIDDGILRGGFTPRFAPASPIWSGVYFGGQLGLSSANANFGNSLHSLSEYILRNLYIADQVSDMTTLPNESVHGKGFGGFIGYNWLVDTNLILGAELNYSRVDLDSSSSALTQAKILNNGNIPSPPHHIYHDITVDGSASVRIKDYATVRARAGWQVDQFLPYAFIGGAIGRADYTVSDHITDYTTDVPDVTNPATPALYNNDLTVNAGKTESKTDAIAYGMTGGLGIEVAVWSNVFLRAEWEYIYFAPIHDIQVTINSGHVGIGMRF